MAWWKSAAGDAALMRLARTQVTLVPTLVRYEAAINSPESPEIRNARAAFLPDLLWLVGKFHRAGVPLLAGSDLVGLSSGPATDAGTAREIELLQKAGLSASDARYAGSADALIKWFASNPAF
jgi:hypothetical protein